MQSVERMRNSREIFLLLFLNCSLLLGEVDVPVIPSDTEREGQAVVDTQSEPEAPPLENSPVDVDVPPTYRAWAESANASQVPGAFACQKTANVYSQSCEAESCGAIFAEAESVLGNQTVQIFNAETICTRGLERLFNRSRGPSAQLPVQECIDTCTVESRRGPSIESNL